VRLRLAIKAAAGGHLVTMPQGGLRVADSMQRKSIKRRYFRCALSVEAPAGAER
jgi:hypothetical protein